MFSVDYFSTNLRQYSSWLLDMETPFIALAAAGWFVLRRREGSPPRFSNLFLAFAVVLYACYALYLPFDNWTFLRFLLPGIAVLLLLCGLTVLHVAERLGSFLPKILLVAFFVVFLAWRWDVMGLQPIPPQDRSAAVVGAYVRDHLPENAVVISMVHSGSLRYYSGRLTVRWDWLRPEWLDRSLVFFTSNGYRPFLLLEADERRPFIQRFSGHSKIGSLRFAPITTHRGRIQADLYDLSSGIRD
jgi:hypothetical protein